MEAFSTAAVHVRLHPRVPIDPDVPATSWFGGDPSLPQGTKWPRIGERDAPFVWQIDCGDLPDDLWHGLGPRDGWLVVVGGDTETRVLHTTELGERRRGPDQGDAGWFRPSEMYKGLRRTARWPVDIVTHRTSSAQSWYGPEGRANASGERPQVDLGNAAFRPYDGPTLALLFERFDDDIDRGPGAPARILSDQRYPVSEVEEVLFLDQDKTIKAAARAHRALRTEADRFCAAPMPGKTR